MTFTTKGITTTGMFLPDKVDHVRDGALTNAQLYWHLRDNEFVESLEHKTGGGIDVLYWTNTFGTKFVRTRSA